MSTNKTNTYETDFHIAEIYDKLVTGTDDIEQIRRLIGQQKSLRILEPFCGTGRIILELAKDGHDVVGLDQSSVLLCKAYEKMLHLPDDICKRVMLMQMDVTTHKWPGEFDVVLLAGNCFYELATPEEQEICITSAYSSLKPGGCLYYDSDHMEGPLHESWQKIGHISRKGFPCGTCVDGVSLEGTMEAVWCDVPNRLWRAKRGIIITYPDGTVISREWEQQKHPVSAYEIKALLDKHGFIIEKHYGNSRDEPYRDDLNRTTFWARKEQEHAL